MKDLNELITTLKMINPEYMDVLTYNKFIKDNICTETLVEIFFDDILQYVESEIGEEGIKGLDRIINRFTESDIEEVLKGYDNRQKYELLGKFDYKENATLDDIKVALESLKVDIKDIRLITWVNAYGGRKSEEVLKMINTALEGRDADILNSIKEYIANRYYYNWFYEDLRLVANKVIDSYSNKACSVRIKVNFYLNFKEEQLKKMTKELVDLM